jgi:uncharacterized protein YndB with AHSA1/START domain
MNDDTRRSPIHYSPFTIKTMRDDHTNSSSAWTNAMFSKIFMATREELFSAWTDAPKVAAWWGPSGFTNPVCRWNATPNGEIYIEMTAPDGMVFPLKGIFYEVIAPEQLLFITRAFEDNQGNAQVEVLASVILTKVNNKTKLTVEATVMKSVPEVYCFLETMYEGWKQSLEKLEVYLTGN